jgi:hypothetical protein
MKAGISNILSKFKEAISSGAAKHHDNVAPFGRVKIEITRADGSIEEHAVNNIVTAIGLDALASRGVLDTTSPFKYIIIGSETDAGSLGSTQAGIGEVHRKIAATLASSKEVMVLVATWAGNADSISGVPLASAGLGNHASSGSGILGNHVNSVDATLNDSDFLKVQVEIQIGSHNL